MYWYTYLHFFHVYGVNNIWYFILIITIPSLLHVKMRTREAQLSSNRVRWCTYSIKHRVPTYIEGNRENLLKTWRQLFWCTAIVARRAPPPPWCPVCYASRPMAWRGREILLCDWMEVHVGKERWGDLILAQYTKEPLYTRRDTVGPS